MTSEAKDGAERASEASNEFCLNQVCEREKSSDVTHSDEFLTKSAQFLGTVPFLRSCTVEKSSSNTR